jgi:hypothetical protein
MATQGGAPLVERVKGILITPKPEWERIDAEPDTVGGIFQRYVLILAAIPVIASLIGQLAFGIRVFGIVVRPSVTSAVGTAVVTYILTLCGVFVLALIIDALAPTFAGTKNRVQAFKVAAYSMTAAWVAGIVGLLPVLGLVTLVSIIGGIYSLYLLYLGLPRLMKSPADKAVPYTVSVIVAAIVLYFVIGVLSTQLLSATGLSRPNEIPDISGSVEIPGVGSMDVGKLEAATKRLEESAKRMEAGAQQPAVAAASLQALLPETLGQFRRVEVSSSSASAGGFGGSAAEARYESGESSFELTVTDIAAAGAIAALGSALNVQANRQTETGYEKTATVGGRMVTEKWDRQAGRGSYGVLVADRFMVEADGKVPSVDVLKAAVNSVGLARLESMKG